MREATTIELIRALSPRGADLFSQELGWLNPLPATAGQLLSKLDLAIERAAYIQDQTGTTESSTSALSALKSEITAVLACGWRNLPNKPLQATRETRAPERRRWAARAV